MDIITEEDELEGRKLAVRTRPGYVCLMCWYSAFATVFSAEMHLELMALRLTREERETATSVVRWSSNH